MNTRVTRRNLLALLAAAPFVPILGRLFRPLWVSEPTPWLRVDWEVLELSILPIPANSDFPGLLEVLRRRCHRVEA